jgi:hypothetical protein
MSGKQPQRLKRCLWPYNPLASRGRVVGPTVVAALTLHQRTILSTKQAVTCGGGQQMKGNREFSRGNGHLE